MVKLESGRKILDGDILKDAICNYKRYLTDAKKVEGVEATNHILEMIDKTDVRTVVEVKPGWWLVHWADYDASEQARNSL